MAKGETEYNSAGRKVIMFDNTPLPTKDPYEGKLVKGTWEIKKSSGKGKLPYLSGKVEILNTAKQKKGKNRTAFHNFFLNTTPKPGGKPHVDMGDQITAYIKAIDAKAKLGLIPATKTDDDGNESKVMIIDPKKLLKFIDATAGRVFSFKLKNEPSQNDPDVKFPKVSMFLEAGAAGGDEEDGGDEDEEDDDDDDEGSEDDEDDSESDDDEDDNDDEDEDEDEEDDDDDDESDEDEDEDEDSDDEDESDEEDDDDEEDSDDDDDEDEAEEVKPKRRGRPPGSKNKPKGKKGKK